MGASTASETKDERPSPTPDSAFAKRKATGVRLPEVAMLILVETKSEE